MSDWIDLRADHQPDLSTLHLILQRHEPAPHVDDCSWDRATCIQTGPESSPLMQAGCRPSATCCVAPGFLSFCERSLWAGYWKSDAGQGTCFATSRGRKSVGVGKMV